MKNHIGITETHRAAVAKVINVILADEFVLSTKTRNAHWNVEGANFHSLHLFFESQFGALDEIVDNLAERIRSLGHYAPASLKDFLALTNFSERLHEKNNGEGFIKELLNDHESIIIRLRENIDYFHDELGDAGSSDFFTQLIETHEKMAWMLRSHLK
jgi:starvation-inducible DNA-binding protein